MLSGKNITQGLLRRILVSDTGYVRMAVITRDSAGTTPVLA